MLRTVTLIGLALGTLGGAIAGTVVPINLTTSPVSITTCTGFGCTPTPPSATTTGTFETTLFSTQAPPSSITPSPVAQTVGPTSFILAAQGGGNDEYISAAGSNKDTSILIDLGSCTGTAATGACGLQNVDNIYTMIQANGDVFGDQGVTVSFSGVNGLNAAISGTIFLTAGIDYRAVSSAIPGSETCTDANSNNPTKNVGTACTAATAGSDTSALTGTDSTPGGTLAGASVVTTNNGFGALTNGTNNYYLDVQELELGTNFLGGGYLDSITIQSNSPNASNSKILLSGLSADVVASAPEPGTVALLGLGLGLGAFWKLRNRRTNRLPTVD